MVDSDLKVRFFHMAHSMKKVRMQKLFPDISQGEYMILGHIAQAMEKTSEGIIVSELARRLEISLPTTSRFLKGLEEKGWIIRKMNATDRRNIQVELTREGQEMKDHMTSVMHEFFDVIVNRLGDEKAEFFVDVVKEITEIMEDELKKRERDQT